jgi:hypothetical protein
MQPRQKAARLISNVIQARYFQRTLDLGESVFTAISHSFFEAKISGDIG